ncbi:MAG: Crp/Fnr family transcriptional regulator [Verrucomicrobiae bacterium]|nr:Crp/Fnr family transcriptional regulator [Verrucomicrobiae bacterium]
MLNELRETAIIGALRACQLFAGLGAADLRSVARIAVVKRLDKGDYLFREGEKALGFYVVQRGTINVHKIGAGGKELVIHLFRAGDSFAEAVVASEGGYPADARATEPSQVVLIPRNDFLLLLQSKPELALRMLASLSKRLRMMVALVTDLSLQSIETRVANWLLRRCPDPASKTPVNVILPATKRLLAAELGTVSETLSRTLAKFRSRGLIKVHGRVVTVVEPAGLLALVQDVELR